MTDKWYSEEGEKPPKYIFSYLDGSGEAHIKSGGEVLYESAGFIKWDCQNVNLKNEWERRAGKFIECYIKSEVSISGKLVAYPSELKPGGQP